MYAKWEQEIHLLSVNCCLCRLGTTEYQTSDTVAAAQIRHYSKFLIRETQRTRTILCWWTRTWGRKQPGFLKGSESSAGAPRELEVPAGAHWSDSAPPQQPSQELSREMLVVLAPLLVDNCPPHTWLSLGWGEVMNRPTKRTQASLPREATFDQCWATYAGLSRGARRQLRKKRALL